MLSLRELERTARIIREELIGAILRRVAQPEEQALILTFEASSGKTHLLLSISPEHARICLTEPPESASSPGSFYQYGRAHWVGCALAEVKTFREERQIALCLRSRESFFELIFSIMGPRSNIYLLDSNRRLLHSMRPLDDTRRDLKMGEAWVDPEGGAPEGIDRWEAVPDSQYLSSIAETYRHLELKHKAEQMGRRIEQAVKKERAFLDRKSVNLLEDLGEARQAEALRHKGELLKNVLHTIRSGDEQAMATDYQTGEPFEIPLDPRLSPVENLEAYFARYQKETRGVKMIQQQLDEVEAAQNALDEIEQRLKDALQDAFGNRQVLEEMASQHEVRRLIVRYAPRRKPSVPAARPAAKKKEIPAKLLPKRYRTQDGLEIWVGRNDEGNDYLTTRLARGNDLFFHLDGYPGSHVVLRTEGRTDPPSKSILDACELAVHFSKMKNAGNADVHMAPIKNIKKPKGAKPGLVYVRGGKTIHLRHDAKRLESILASRMEGEEGEAGNKKSERLP